MDDRPEEPLDRNKYIFSSLCSLWECMKKLMEFSIQKFHYARLGWKLKIDFNYLQKLIHNVKGVRKHC